MLRFWFYSACQEVGTLVTSKSSPLIWCDTNDQRRITDAELLEKKFPTEQLH
jgi:hypothetical protein